MKVSFSEMTPNPDARKFRVEPALPITGARQFEEASTAASDPLASALFALGTVRAVYFTPEFITVTKYPNADWDELSPQIKATVEFKGDLVEAHSAAGAALSGDDLYDRINSVIDKRVRPALAGDGGGLEVLGLNDHTLVIRYQGACGGCPSATRGTLRAIEHLLQHEVDPNLSVVSG